MKQNSCNCCSDTAVTLFSKPMKCTKCNKTVIPYFLDNKRVCFSCHFWDETLKRDKTYPPHKVCIIDGVHYVIAPEDSTDPFRGFGGHKFQIEFFDGTKVTTTNLWHQGEIPEIWKEKFKNNARFV